MRILFICFGNTCRGPMAAALAGRLLGEEWSCDSAGIVSGDGADPRAIRQMEKEGLDISGHVSKRLAEVDASSFDYVVSLDAEIVDDIRRIAGPLPQLRVWDIPDPYVFDEAAYENASSMITGQLQEFAGTEIRS